MANTTITSRTIIRACKRRRNSLFLIITGLFFFLASGYSATAATYYVDANNGNDSNPGTSELPWKTLGRAYTWYSGAYTPKVAEGDTVIFRNGNYGTFKESTNDGQSYLFYRNNWITYEAAPGHKPILDNVDILNADKWHTPRDDGDSYLKIIGFRILTGVNMMYTSYVQITDCNVTQAEQVYEGAYAPYYWPGIICVAGAAVNHVTIEGCDISHSYRGINIGTNSSNISIRNNCLHHFGEDGMIIIATNVSIEDNLVYDIHSYRAPINIGGTTIGSFALGDVVTLNSNPLTYGIVCRVTSVIEIWQTSELSFFNGAPSLANLRGNTITGPNGTITSINYVDGPHCDGVTIGGTGATCNNINFVRNKILRNLPGDAGLLFGAQALKLDSPKNIVIANNLLVSAGPSSGLAVSLLMGGGTTDFNCNNNIMVGMMSIRNLGNPPLEINNFYNNIISYFRTDGDSATVHPNIVNHGNNIFGNNPNGLGGPSYPFAVNGTEIVNYNINNLFVNAAINDFNLAPNSVAKNFGNPSYAPLTDILGNTRDLAPDAGCYEYIPSDSNNHAPVLDEIGNKSLNKNTLISFSVNATDADGDSIDYSILGQPSGATFSNHTFSWTPTDLQVGTHSVTFVARDSHGIGDSETITITVRSTNQPPVLAAIGNKSVTENNTLSFSINATDSDGDTLTYSSQHLPNGSVFSGQTFTWMPDYDRSGEYQITFIVSDGSAQDSETITITVNNNNRPVVLNSIGNKSVSAQDTLSFNLGAVDPDNDNITYSATGLPSGAAFSGQNFSWTPNNSQAGSYNVTFTADDGQSQDSETITITVAVDNTAPIVTVLSPAADSIQVPINSLISISISDDGIGVSAGTVNIEINGNLIYTGNTTDYESQYGHCRRTGTKASYRYYYQANEKYDYDQLITVTVNAADLGGRVMDEYSYSFRTQMRSFGQNKRVDTGISGINNSTPSTASDSSGNVWVVWQTGPAGSRDIYISKLVDDADSFSNSVQVTNNSADQCNPVIVIDSNKKLYAAWQDNRNGEWDIYLSTSTNGTIWSAATKVTDPNSNQTNPVIAIDSSNKVYIAWVDDRNGNNDIYIASSSDGFVSNTSTRVTSDVSDQSEPAITIGSNNTVYMVWKDARAGTSDIYGADSYNAWTNVAVVSKQGNQTDPAIAAEVSGSVLHLLWVDDVSGNNDIYYASTNGLPGSPLSGINLIDDDTGSDQSAPALITTGSTGSNLKVFACWRDERNVSAGNGDTDIYFVQVNSGSGTNIFLGDDSTNSGQNAPAMCLDKFGYPCVVWTDGRNDTDNIYYAASTYIDPQAIAQKQVSSVVSSVVGTDPAQITKIDDVSIIIPAGVCQNTAQVVISKIRNMPLSSLGTPVASYDFGPSGMDFDGFVTVIIPYDPRLYSDTLNPYCYESYEHVPSQDGITAIERIMLSPTLYAMRFRTEHFSRFFLAEGDEASEPNVVWRFGSFGGQKNVKLVVTDAQGNPVELSLRGDGYGEIIEDGDLSQIVLHGTTEKSSLKVTAKNQGTEGTIGDIIVDGSLKDITTKRTNLSGDITVSGSLGKLTIGNVSESDITIGSTSNSRISTLFKFGRISDMSINSEMAIKGITATDWLDTDLMADQINAPTIYSLKITGNRRINVNGDFYADLALTGNTSNYSLCSASIAGSLIDSIWNINGSLASLSVNGAVQNSRICSTGSISKINIGAAYDSDFLAGCDTAFSDRRVNAYSDFVTTNAEIKSFNVKGIRTNPNEYYFSNSNVSAPSIKAVAIKNLQTQNSGYDFGIWAWDTEAEIDLGKVVNKSTIDKNENFTFKQGSGIPGNVDDFWISIFAP